MLKTPKESLTLVLLIVTLYLTAPFVEAFILYRELQAGKFLTHADSIGIPLGAFMISWTVGLPIIATGTVRLCKDYRPEISLFVNNPKRPVWSLFWTTVFSFLIFASVLRVITDPLGQYFVEVVQAMGLAYMFVLMRASVVLKNGGLKWAYS